MVLFVSKSGYHACIPRACPGLFLAVFQSLKTRRPQGFWRAFTTLFITIQTFSNMDFIGDHCEDRGRQKHTVC